MKIQCERVQMYLHNENGPSIRYDWKDATVEVVGGFIRVIGIMNTGLSYTDKAEDWQHRNKIFGSGAMESMDLTEKA